MLIQPLILPGDDAHELAQLTEELTTHFNTSDLAAARAVREMIHAEWTLRRARRMLAAAGESHPAAAQLEARAQKQYDRAYAHWTRLEETARREDGQDIRQRVRHLYA